MKKKKMALLLSAAMVIFAGCGTPANESSEDTDKGKRDINQSIDDAVNNVPTATLQAVTLDEDGSKTITLTGIDIDNNDLTFEVVTEPANGTFVGTTYTPNTNFNGTDSFTFKANDGALDSAPATVSITVNSVNDAPTVDAGDDLNITEKDSFSPNFTSNDSDGYIVEEDTVWRENGAIITFPKTDFTVGEHILTVTVTDNEGLDANDTLTLTVNPLVIPLIATGQTISYYANDDGNLTKGAARSFTRDDINETVTDNVTGLMWQDDAQAQNDTWANAVSYCAELELGAFTNWRLPSIKELIYLTDKGIENPAIDPVFENITSYYWSNTEYILNTSQAWYLKSSDSSYNTLIKSNSIVNSRCVRDIQ